jgi:DNA repair exonuclease SbcCD ATPase subunit
MTSPISGASREPRAPIMSPISPQENARATKWVVANNAKSRQPTGHSSHSATPNGLRNLRQDSRCSFSTDVPPASSSTVLEDSRIDSEEQTRERGQIAKLEQEALNREKTVAKLRKRTAEQDDEIRENEERIQQLVAGRAEDNASLAERARTIADQHQKLRQLQAQTDRLLAERTQQVAQLEQGTQKDRLVERLRGTLSDVAEQVQGSLDEIKGSWGMNAVEKPIK